jgi:hypothetical protein
MNCQLNEPPVYLGEPLDMELADGKKCKVIVLDTEGFGAPTATSDSDAQLFSLATMLSSLLIYNR